MRGTLQYLSADFRDGQITVAGKKYPAGTFCVHLLNRFYAHDTAARIAVFKTNILQVQRTLDARVNESESLGLYNTHHMIRLKYGTAYGLTLYNREGEGLTVVVRMPYKR